MKISLQKTKSLIAAFLVLFSMVGIFSGCSDSENISSEQIKNPPQPVVSNQQTVDTPPCFSCGECQNWTLAKQVTH